MLNVVFDTKMMSSAKDFFSLASFHIFQDMVLSVVQTIDALE